MKIEEILANAPVHLAQAQREAYYDQGYLLIPDVLDENTLGELRAALADVVKLSRSITESDNHFDLETGHSAETPRLRRATYLDDQYPVIWKLCSDSVIVDIAQDLLGPNIRFRELMTNFKWAGGGAEVKWHQDIPFYPHTNLGTCQFLVMLEDVGSDQGPLQIVPGSHRGPIFEHYNDEGEWTGAIKASDLQRAGVDQAVTLTGSAGSVSVHHSCAVHGSAQNLSASGRPVFVITYASADAMPYTAAPYPSSHYRTLIRGEQPRYAHHEAVDIPLPPDWSNGYTSIFSHQDKDR